MTPKELQQQYLESLQGSSKEKPNEFRGRKTLFPEFITHVRKQAAEVARLVGYHNGLHTIKDAFKEYPDVMEEEVKRFEAEQKKA